MDATPQLLELNKNLERLQMGVRDFFCPCEVLNAG